MWWVFFGDTIELVFMFCLTARAGEVMPRSDLSARGQLLYIEI